MNIGHTELDALFYEYSLEHEKAGTNRLDKALAFVKAVEARATYEPLDNTLVEVLERYLALRGEHALNQDQDLKMLRAALNIDGLDIRDARLVPTTPPPAALGPQISALEQDLTFLGFSTASEHYRQATENFTDGNWEASNGQLRSFLEDLFIVACERLCKKSGADPVAALQHMKSTRSLDDAEFNTFKSFWLSIQDKGPHRGLSDDQESLFRLHVATAIARYFVFKIRAAA